MLSYNFWIFFFLFTFTIIYYFLGTWNWEGTTLSSYNGCFGSLYLSHKVYFYIKMLCKLSPVQLHLVMSKTALGAIAVASGTIVGFKMPSSSEYQPN